MAHFTANSQPLSNSDNWTLNHSCDQESADEYFDFQSHMSSETSIDHEDTIKSNDNSAEHESTDYGDDFFLKQKPYLPTSSETQEIISNAPPTQTHGGWGPFLGPFPLELWFNVLQHSSGEELIILMRLNKLWLNFIAPLLFGDIHAIVGFDRNLQDTSFQAICIEHPDFGDFELFQRNIFTDFDVIFNIFKNTLSNPNSIMRPFYKNFSIDVIFRPDYLYYAENLERLQSQVNNVRGDRDDDKIDYMNMPQDIILDTRFFHHAMKSQAISPPGLAASCDHKLLLDQPFNGIEVDEDDFFFNYDPADYYYGDWENDHIQRYRNMKGLTFFKNALLDRFVANINSGMRFIAFNLVSDPNSVLQNYEKNRTLLANSEAYVEILGLDEDKPKDSRFFPFEYEYFTDISKPEIDDFLNLIGNALGFTNCDEHYFSVVYAGIKPVSNRFSAPERPCEALFPHIFSAKAGRPDRELRSAYIPYYGQVKAKTKR